MGVTVVNVKIVEISSRFLYKPAFLHSHHSLCYRLRRLHRYVLLHSSTVKQHEDAEDILAQCKQRESSRRQQDRRTASGQRAKSDIMRVILCKRRRNGSKLLESLHMTDTLQ